MGISVRDVLQLPALRGSTIIAGARGIDNSVEGISLMESNDSIEFIPSGTLILSNARALANYLGPYCSLVRQLSEKHVSGIAIKRNRYLKDIPDELIQSADSLGFPIVLVPSEPTPASIINSITYEVFRTEANDRDCTFDESLLKNLAIGNEDAAVSRNRLASLGGDAKQLMGVVAVWSEERLSDHTFNEARKAAGFKYGFEMFETRLLVMELEEGEAGQLNAACGRLLEELRSANAGIAWYFGMSLETNFLIHLSRSYYEAQNSLWFAVANNHPNTVYQFERLGIYSILLNPRNYQEFNHYIDDTLGRLKRHDHLNGSDFFNTLVTYAECDESVERSAEVLGVHFNTVRHRLKEIRRILLEQALDGDINLAIKTLCQTIKWMEVRQRLHGAHAKRKLTVH